MDGPENIFKFKKNQRQQYKLSTLWESTASYFYAQMFQRLFTYLIGGGFVVSSTPVVTPNNKQKKKKRKKKNSSKRLFIFSPLTLWADVSASASDPSVRFVQFLVRPLPDPAQDVPLLH